MFDPEILEQAILNATLRAELEWANLRAAAHPPSK